VTTEPADLGTAALVAPTLAVGLGTLVVSYALGRLIL
jgi:hypothetical protein